MENILSYQKDVVNINAWGEKIVTLKSNFFNCKYDNIMMDLIKNNTNDEEIFVDIHPQYFHAILDIIRKSKEDHLNEITFETEEEKEEYINKKRRFIITVAGKVNKEIFPEIAEAFFREDGKKVFTDFEYKSSK